MAGKQGVKRAGRRKKLAPFGNRFGRCATAHMPQVRFARIPLSARDIADGRRQETPTARSVTRASQYAAASPPTGAHARPQPQYAPAATPSSRKRGGLMLLVLIAVLAMMAAFYVHVNQGQFHHRGSGFVMETYDDVSSSSDARLYEITGGDSESISGLDVEVTQQPHALEVTATASAAEGCAVESLRCELIDTGENVVFSETNVGASATWSIPSVAGKYDIRVTAFASDGSDKTVKYSSYAIAADDEQVLAWPVEPQYRMLVHDYYQVDSGAQTNSGFTHNNGLRRKKHYVYGNARSHYGLDITAAPGSEVAAAAAGTVMGLFYDSDSIGSTGYGKYLIMQHDEPIMGNIVYTLYAHLSDIMVRKGAHCGQGELIALSGSTGGSRIAHLHFEVRVGDSTKASTIDPLDLLPERSLEELPTTLDPTLGFAQSSCALYDAMLAGEWEYTIYALTNAAISDSDISVPPGVQVEVVRRNDTEVTCRYDGRTFTCQSAQLVYTYDLPVDISE